MNVHITFYQRLVGRIDLCPACTEYVVPSYNNAGH